MKNKIPPIRARIFKALESHRQQWFVAMTQDDDTALADMTAGVGQLAAQVTSNLMPHQGQRFIHRDVLMKIAGHVGGWLYRLDAGPDIFDLIHQERERQCQLFRSGNITFDCASKTVDAKRKLRVLVEEVGEVARELFNLENNSGYVTERKIRQCLKNELVQVAAVVVAWLESLEVMS